ncbi:MAG: twin-arginine translocation signal domain-containing protein, partial [Syntrophomonas sp.]
MKVTRRQFLKVTGATAASFAVLDLGFDMQATAKAVKDLRIKNVTPTPTVCPYCASGCGLVVYSERDAAGKFVKLLSVQGDPDNPINQGGACAKGAAM